MYRYMLGDKIYGGCVLALTKKEAIKKVEKYYEKYYEILPETDLKVTVWLDDEFPPDLVEIY